MDDYSPVDHGITVEELDLLEVKLTETLAALTQRDNAVTLERSALRTYFDSKGGLHDRAVRAKMHVKRKYGIKSDEYRSLVNKKY